MTNSDGDNWEEDCSHISTAIWLPDSRGCAAATPSDAAKCGWIPLKTAPQFRWLIQADDWWSRSIYHGTPLQLPRSEALLISASLYHKCKESWEILQRQEQYVRSAVGMRTNKPALDSFWNGNPVPHRISVWMQRCQAHRMQVASHHLIT